MKLSLIGPSLLEKQTSEGSGVVDDSALSNNGYAVDTLVEARPTSRHRFSERLPDRRCDRRQD